MIRVVGIGNVLRASAVKRWDTVEVFKEQSMAEHAFNVTAIARNIAILAGVDSHSLNVIKTAALDHDLAEVMTGDVITPTKQKMREMGFEPDTIVSWGNSWKDGLTPNELLIIKAADLVEAIVFIAKWGQTEHGKLVATRMEEQLVELTKDVPKAIHDAVWRTAFECGRINLL